MSKEPFISICTPIFNRTKWKPLMKFNLRNLDYPKDKLEWSILDSYDNKDVEWDKLFKNKKEVLDFENKVGIKINYVCDNNSYTIGQKRNKLVKMSSHNIIANMDSDDAMLSNWLKHSLEVMNSDKKCSFVGTPEMQFVFPHYDYKMTGIKCPQIRMVHEAASVFTKGHWKKMNGYARSSCGEGTSLIDGLESRCLPTSAEQCIICICHNDNTIDKDRFKDKCDRDVRLTGALKKIIDKIINNPKIET